MAVTAASETREPNGMAIRISYACVCNAVIQLMGVCRMNGKPESLMYLIKCIYVRAHAVLGVMHAIKHRWGERAAKRRSVMFAALRALNTVAAGCTSLYDCRATSNTHCHAHGCRCNACGAVYSFPTPSTFDIQLNHAFLEPSR